MTNSCDCTPRRLPGVNLVFTTQVHFSLFTWHECDVFRVSCLKIQPETGRALYRVGDQLESELTSKANDTVKIGAALEAAEADRDRLTRECADLKESAEELQRRKADQLTRVSAILASNRRLIGKQWGSQAVRESRSTYIPGQMHRRMLV